MHYRHWVRRNRGKNLKYAPIVRIRGVKVNLYIKMESIRAKLGFDNDTECNRRAFSRRKSGYSGMAPERAVPAARSMETEKYQLTLRNEEFFIVRFPTFVVYDAAYASRANTFTPLDAARALKYFRA